MFNRSTLLTILHLTIFITAIACAQPPSLPKGLENQEKEQKDSQPSLPSGLQSDQAKQTDVDTPTLPTGLKTKGKSQQKNKLQNEEITEVDLTPKWLDINGFFETRVGYRTQNDKY